MVICTKLDQETMEFFALAAGKSEHTPLNPVGTTNSAVAIEIYNSAAEQEGGIPDWRFIYSRGS